MPALSCAAPAKLNLFLHITGRRADGYHTLQTVFQLLDYSDTLHFNLRDDAVISRLTSLPGIPEAHDLAIRAARILQAHTRCRCGVDISIEKRLPVGAGLGGGSSDAATTLLALNQLWELHLSRAQLQRLALSLGADAPFFIFGRNAFAQGIGDKLQTVDLPQRHFLIVTPNVQVPTAEIFNAPELTRNTKIIKMTDFLRQRHPIRWPDDFGHNDMQPVAAGRYMEIAHVLDWFKKVAPARMTGSGASVFSAFRSREQALAVQSNLPPGWRSVVATSLALHPLFSFAS